MAGLALGAWLVERFLPRISRPMLRVRSAGVCYRRRRASQCPFLLLAADKLMVLAIGGNAEPPDSSGWFADRLLSCVTAFVVLAVPTACMGATLPLLTRHVVTTPEQIGRRVGLLYAINTLGAAGGALCAAYLLLPALGLTGTVLVGAVVNVIVFALAAAISRVSAPSKRPPPVLGRRAPHRGGSKPAALQRPSAHAWRSAAQLDSSDDAAIRRRILHLRSALDADAEPRSGRQHLCLRHHGRELPARHRRRQCRGVTQLRARSRISLVAFVVCQLAAALASIGIYLGIDALVPRQAGLARQRGPRDGRAPARHVLHRRHFSARSKDPRRRADRAAVASARVYAWNTRRVQSRARSCAGFVLIPAAQVRRHHLPRGARQPGPRLPDVSARCPDPLMVLGGGPRCRCRRRDTVSATAARKAAAHLAAQCRYGRRAALLRGRPLRQRRGAGTERHADAAHQRPARSDDGHARQRAQVQRRILAFIARRDGTPGDEIDAGGRLWRWHRDRRDPAIV